MNITVGDPSRVEPEDYLINWILIITGGDLIAWSRETIYLADRSTNNIGGDLIA